MNIEKFIQSGIDKDVSLKTSRLSIKESKSMSPISYGKYIGARNKLVEI